MTNYNHGFLGIQFVDYASVNGLPKKFNDFMKCISIGEWPQSNPARTPRITGRNTTTEAALCLTTFAQSSRFPLYGLASL